MSHEFNEVHVTRREVDGEGLLGSFAKLSDVSTVINQNSVVKCDGEVVMGYVKNIGGGLDSLRMRLSGFKSWSKGFRATTEKAPKNTSVVFGFQPRLPIRAPTKACRVSALLRQDKVLHELLVSWSKSAASFYMQLAPEKAKAHWDEVQERVVENYRYEHSMFTSGIVNKSNQLPYHYDRGNFKGAWSAMLGLSKGIGGGHLVIPEYDLAISISDGSLCFFDGQSSIHGVTEFNRLVADAERYTIVWYSLEKLWQCLTHKDELAQANQLTTRVARGLSKND